jgi:membrane protease YdiL (CAAX protease family)
MSTTFLSAPAPSGRRQSQWSRYHHATRTGTYGFLSALPLFLLYEVMIVIVNRASVVQVRIGADVWIKQFLELLGAGGHVVLGIVVLLIGMGILVAERKEKIPIRARYFVGILLESTAYAVFVALLVSGIVGAIFAMAPAVAEAVQGLGMRLVLSIGAGLYEELVFRVLLVGGMYLVLKRVLSGSRYAYVVAAVIGAVLFSWVHYIGPFGDPFTLASFTFRFLFGLALNVLFLLRGFGIAAWTHALYDVMVVLAGF